MLNISFSPYVFLRTPALSYADYHNCTPEDLIKSPFFQAAIFFASESLYTELKRFDFNYQLLDKKVQLSLQKYFNRMCYRPTPFGMFSSFSSLNWDKADNADVCVLKNEGLIHVNPDFQFTIDVARLMEKSEAFVGAKYYPNNSIYNIKGEKRFLTSTYDSEQKKTEYSITSFKADRLLNKLMSFCKQGRTRPELVAWLAELTDNIEEARNYILDLIDAGLLISELCPNMAGDKYFDRLASIAEAHADSNELAKEILRYKDLTAKIQSPDSLNIQKLHNNSLLRLTETKLKSMFYVGYERLSATAVDLKYQGYIKDGLKCLDKLAQSTTPASLATFKTKFKARFENQEIPLLQALDREAGVGYHGLEKNLVTSHLLDGIHLDLQSNSLNFNWTPVHEFFLSKLSDIRTQSCITISDKDLDKLNAGSELKPPPSFSVIFRVFEDKIWVEQAGGCSSAAILGRFTLFSDTVLEQTRNIISAEEKTNPAVIFAEISCFNDEHAANINSNAGVRGYEIPIGVHSTLREDHILNLSDLTVSVNGDSIVLRSKKLNKIVIPRLSSAYNYSRSELSIFRFLCDLQYQGIKWNYNLDLKALLPGLNFYPRVEYKNCIIFPATWLLNSEDIFEICNNNDFKKVADKLNLKRQFALTEGDNQLVFDRDDPASVQLLIKVIKGKNAAIIQEVFIDSSSAVINEDGRPFAGQFTVSITNNEVTYPQHILEPFYKKKKRVKRIYLPGDEWVYLKLYCHPASSNTILTRSIKNVTEGLKKRGILKNWYFIRYNDTDHHLRVRVQINPDDANEVLKHFEKKIRLDFEKGIVNNLLIDTYKREIERYGESSMELVEKVFQFSSELVINILKNISRSETVYSELHFAIISVDAILGVFYPQNSSRINLLKRIHQSMKHEFEDSKQVKFQLDSKYRECAPFINSMAINHAPIAEIAGKKELNAFLKSLRLLHANIPELSAEKTGKLVADLIHMHLNRLFNEKQRMQEFIIYYLLCKYYTSLEARKDKAPVTLTPASDSFRINHIYEAVLK